MKALALGLAALVATAPAALAEPVPSTTPPGAAMTVTVEVRSPVLGTLEVLPPSGTSSTDLTVRTSAPCPSGSDGFSVMLFGPAVFAGGAVMLEPTATGFSTTAPITAELAKTLGEAAASLDAELVVGAYRLVLVCLDRAAGKAVGMFTGDVHLITPTTYRTTPPPTTTPPPPVTTPPPAPKPGGLTDTGAAVGALLFTGAGLLVLGAVFVRLSRRPRQSKETR